MRFYKYQGTGNDFIMLNQEDMKTELSTEEIQEMCNRRFGIGADGLIILKKHPDCDFEMEYFNADGSQSFCGNGSRCAQAFAKKLHWIQSESNFLAIDGMHQGKSEGNLFSTKMGDVDRVEILGNDFFIHTGSPHYIQYVNDLDSMDVQKEGSAIRNRALYRSEGTNVNFVETLPGSLKVRTYERGVEAETFSCGTGVTAVAISWLVKENSQSSTVLIETRGGNLEVGLSREGDANFKNIWLTGPAKEVYKGEWNP